MKKSTVQKQPSFFLFLGLSLVLAEIQTVGASGVFELELIDLQRIDSNGRLLPPPDNKTATPIRIFVCLKEAFTSQLDGPCPFGNATLMLNDKQPQSNFNPDDTENSGSQTNSTTQLRTILKAADGSQTGASLESGTVQVVKRENQNAEDQTELQDLRQQPQRRSPMTNTVRILFTFRWTKSFTIVLTAEHIEAQREDSATEEASTPSTRHMDEERESVALTTGAANKLEAARFNANQLIDRHVLTENEVLPTPTTQTTGGAHKSRPWTIRFSRSLKSTLSYRFRVYCSPNYHGDGCTTFCRPRDDQFGHYNCSSTGQKLCLDGWTGAECEKARCRAGCDQRHGYCTRPDTCECRPGWSGPRCDECVPYPGCQNGYCLSPWQCTCRPDWGGVLCDQYLNYCAAHAPCQNNGTCQNVALGRYKCKCPDGFTGANCEINLSSIMDTAAGCAVNPCQNGGTCYGLDDQLTGELLVGGVAGDIYKPAPEQTSQTLPDAAAARLRDVINPSIRLYRCQCLSGWTGDYCQWADLDPTVILSAGDLLQMAANGSNEDRTSWSSGQINSSESLIQLLNHEEPASEHSIKADEPRAEIEPPGQATVTTSLAADGLTQLQLLPYSTPPPAPHHLHPTLDMRHLISGVVIASSVGVFLAVLLLAWCCLMAIERKRFSFIQMNIVRSVDGSMESSGSSQPRPMVATTLRRFHEKIRDSLRLRSQRLKPETKLSIENVLRPVKPPPSYEESNQHEYYEYKKQSECTSMRPIEIPDEPSADNQLEMPSISAKLKHQNIGDGLELEIDEASGLEARMSRSEDLVKCGSSSALEQQQANQVAHNQPTSASPVEIEAIDDYLLTPNSLKVINCPRHRRIYEQQLRRLQEEAELNRRWTGCEQVRDGATMIEIQYQSAMSSRAAESPSRSQNECVRYG